MIETVGIEAFLVHARAGVVFDVRAPLEYNKGHIPGAHNLALFSDDQRAVVGTLYAKEGKEAAIIKGLELVGGKLAFFVEEVRKHAQSKTVLVYCWRGGMRSKSIAWLLSLAGYRVYILEGGYKTFRAHMSKIFERRFSLIVLGGRTGTGKTKILQELAKQGEQVVDLEGLACHRGSAFGGLGHEAQPTQSQFENNLGIKLLSCDSDKLVWVEDESIRIGSLFIPWPFFDAMQEAPVIFIDKSREQRTSEIIEEYGNYSYDMLEKSIMSIEKHIGGLITKTILEALRIGDKAQAVDLLLDYYDAKYMFGLSKKVPELILSVKLLENDTQTHAQILINHARIFINNVYKSQIVKRLE